ncbi:MarR family winged helix-turn-helix transcriptional regulator [Streptomyces anulatus]|uniref:MarR family winged helix-turn-helix transcriptional regulator n=1 Tax=Streptomyces anulatus TaxID=1892 RepID=UPI003416C8D4
MNDDELHMTAVALRRAATRLSLRLRAERPQDGPGRLGLSLLGHLYRGGPMTAGELADAERLQPQSVTRVLVSLDEKGLISRTRNPSDRRQHRIGLTELGTAVLVEHVRDSDAWLAGEMARVLSPVECRMLRLATDLIDQVLDGGDRRRTGSPVNSAPNQHGSCTERPDQP